MRAIIFGMALLGAQAFAASKVSHSDKKFIKNAAACDRADAKLGELAIEKGVDPQVKALGRRMLDDQAAMDGRLARLADEKKVSLPQKMNDDDRKLYDRLSKLSGDEFDREFLQAMSERQRKAIDAFETAAGTSRDIDVRQFAAQSSTTLRAHRDLANDARQHL
jgi:putative membrane protein